MDSAHTAKEHFQPLVERALTTHMTLTCVQATHMGENKKDSKVPERGRAARGEERERTEGRVIPSFPSNYSRDELATQRDSGGVWRRGKRR